jgi:hypothetical protein
MCCSFFRGKRSRRGYGVIKRDGTNVEANVGERGWGVKGGWWRGKDADISRAFVLVSGREEVVRFVVDVVGGGGEFGNGCDALQDGVEHVSDVIVELTLRVACAVEEVVSIDVELVAADAQRGRGGEEGDAKFASKKDGVRGIWDAVGGNVTWEAMECKAGEGVEEGG